jgi:hypothetical protein
MTIRTIAAAAVLAFALALAACDDTQTTPTTPTTPASPTTATWTGILPVPGTVSRSFYSTQAGNATVTLTEISATPRPLMLGIGIPLSGGSGCTLTQVVPAVAQSSPIFNVRVDAGTYCLKMIDTQNPPGTVTFSVTLVHP